jgi:hypothetical protein
MANDRALNSDGIGPTHVSCLGERGLFIPRGLWTEVRQSQATRGHQGKAERRKSSADDAFGRTFPKPGDVRQATNRIVRTL